MIWDDPAFWADLDLSTPGRKASRSAQSVGSSPTLSAASRRPSVPAGPPGGRTPRSRPVEWILLVVAWVIAALIVWAVVHVGSRDDPD